MTTPPLDELVQNYLEWLKNIKCAPYQTFRAYQVDLIHFLKYFLHLEQTNIPSKNEIEEYLATMKSKYNYSSYRRKVTVLRNFTRYLIESGINVSDPFISITLPMPEINFNLPLQYEDVLNLIDSLSENTSREIRDKLIFSLIAKSGLTIKQLLSLKIKDINLATNQIIVSRNQLTFVDAKTSLLLKEYFSKINEISQVSLNDYLICTRDIPHHASKNIKLPLSTRSINLIIDKTAKKMDFKARLSPTILRRSFAKSLKEKNINQATKELIFGKKCRLVG